MRTSKLFDLSGEVAVVIGASGVLGGAIAEGLAEAGAAVAVIGRNTERGEARAESIRKLGGKAQFFRADCLEKSSLAAAHVEVQSTLGHVSVLVNAAGGNTPAATVTSENGFENIGRDDWSACFDLNLTGGALLPCQEFGPAMAKRGKGSIINIGSASAHVPLSRVIAYSAAKAAVLNLTMFLAREWADKGVRVNSVSPGFFPAEQNRKLLFNDDGSPTPRTKSILSHTPMGRFGKPGELVGAVVFLASPTASSFITGVDLRVDGGFLAQTI